MQEYGFVLLIQLYSFVVIRARKQTEQIIIEAGKKGHVP